MALKWYEIVGIVIGVILIIGLIVVFIFIFVGLGGSTEPPEPPGPPVPVNNILKITNNFAFPLWVEARYGNNGVPVPVGQDLYLDNDTLTKYASTTDEQNYWKSAITTVEIPPNTSVFYNIDPGGIAGARFWGKFACSSCGSEENGGPAFCLPPYPVGCAVGGNCTFPGAGTACVIGDSSQYYVPPNSTSTGGSIGGCPAPNCAPAVDSLFEATFLCSLDDQSQCNVNPSSSNGQLLGPTTFFDTSQVNGYTLPYIVLATGSINTCVNNNSTDPMPTVTVDQEQAAYIDGSGLISGTSGLIMDYNGTVGCPTNANLSLGTVNTVVDPSLPVTYDITNVDLGIYVDAASGTLTYPYIEGSTTTGFTPGTNVPANSVKIACMSSCQKLNYAQPYGMNQSVACIPGLYYCCPTTLLTPGCTGTTGCCEGISSGCASNTSNQTVKTGCITSQQCTAGPVSTSEYVQSIHNMAPGIYAYAYDDSQGLYSCGSNVSYEVIFGPPGATPTDYWNNLWSKLSSSSQ